MRIRIAQAEDATQLAAVAKKAFYQAFADDPRNSPEDMRIYTDKAFSVGQILSELQDNSIVYFILEGAENIVGYAKLKPMSTIECVLADKPIELCRLYLLKEHIGKGLGAILMNRCIEFARMHGHDVMWLGVWEYNFRAQQFYNKFGFERVGEHIFQLGNDPQIDWILQKKLL